jgi:DNA-binding transcriptional regulator YhcF (GntR family)
MLILEIDTHGPVPIYEQIVDGIQRLVRRGDLVPGSPLASVRQLACDLEINANTVARAYRTLEMDGILETAGRRGTRVAADAPNRARDALTGRLDDLADRMIRETAHLGVGPDDLITALVKRLESKPETTKTSGRTT